MLILPQMARANQNKTHYPQMTTYIDDFSFDPGWVSNDPTNLRRDPANNTFHGWQSDTGTSYAYTLVNWDGRTSFQLDYDLKINSCGWAAGCTFGLFGTNLLSNFNQPMMVADFSVSDGGHCLNLLANSGTQTASLSDGNCGLWTERVWYRVSVRYDAVAGQARLTVRNRDTGEQVIDRTVTISAPFGNGLPYLGASRLFIEGYSSTAVDYNLDNIELSFLPAYVQDFSTDPGWVTNDPTNLRRDPTNNTFHGWQSDTGTSYAYTPVNWDGKTSFQLDYDLKINSCGWAAGCTFGLFGTNLLSNFNQPMMVADFSVSDGGHCLNLLANDGAQTASLSDGNCGLWTEGVWYQVSVRYDAVAGQARLTVGNRDTGEQVTDRTVTIGAPFGNGLLYLGASRLFIEGYSNTAVDYNLDNIRFATSTSQLSVSGRDTDGDGLPDAWELEHFGNLAQTGSGDPDGDGVTNLQEYQNGSSPTVFDIGPMSIWTAVEVGWRSVAGTNYQVQWAWSLETNTWHNLGSPIPGNGSMKTALESTRGQTKKFYRVILAP